MLIAYVPFYLFFFFFQEGQLPIFLKAELSAGLIFLPSFKHYSYYLIFQNNTVAEIPTLRMQCFPVFIQPAVWISFPCFYTTKMLRYLQAFECFSPQLVTLSRAMNTHDLSKSVPGSLSDKKQIRERSDFIFK